MGHLQCPEEAGAPALQRPLLSGRTGTGAHPVRNPGDFFLSPQSSASLWHHCEHRETYQRLLEDIAVLHRLAARLSSRAEMVGAVRQVSLASSQPC